MLFNSGVFLFAFLPLVLLGYGLIARTLGQRAAMTWLVLSSFFYYAWWDVRYLPLLLGSILFNFLLGIRLARLGPGLAKQVTLGIGVAANLVLLGYFKYANFLVDNLEALTGLTSLRLDPITLPIAISFFTFQQIAYLVDAARAETEDYDPIDYSLFISFFPQLIAGPIVHHKEMMPQFYERGGDRLRARDVSIGLTILVIGLFKKVVIADTMARHASPVFALADGGAQPSMIAAWLGLLSYAMQLYFDFSGYSDMAIGIARLFGIRLPANFNSPYKADSIVDFWRRWHITLSRFLRDYLYIGLGGNRKGRVRRYLNLMLTMLLGGLWHGAGWTFVVWGGLHGFYLCINHLWSATVLAGTRASDRTGLLWRIRRPIAVLLTFAAVNLSWIFFRAQSFGGALRLLQGLVDPGAGTTPAGFDPRWPLLELAVLLPVVWFWPNTQEIMWRDAPVLPGQGAPARRTQRLFGLVPICWRPNLIWALLIALMFVAAVLCLSRPSEFIYYQF